MLAECLVLAVERDSTKDIGQLYQVYPQISEVELVADHGLHVLLSGQRANLETQSSSKSIK